MHGCLFRTDIIQLIDTIAWKGDLSKIRMAQLAKPSIYCKEFEAPLLRGCLVGIRTLRHILVAKWQQREIVVKLVCIKRGKVWINQTSSEPGKRCQDRLLRQSNFIVTL